MKHNISLLFSLTEGAFWLANGLASGYASVYLQGLGYGSVAIGLYFMTIGIFALASQPVWGYLSDRYGCVRAMFLTAFSVLAATMFAFFRWGRSFPVALAWAAVTGLSTGSMSGLLDSWITKLQKEGCALDYGKARSAGSIIYAFGSIGIGQALARFSNACAPWLMTACCAAMFPLLLRIPQPKPQRDPDGSVVTTREAAAYLLHNRDFMVFIGCSFLAMFTLQAHFTYFPLLITDLGGSEAAVGAGYFFMAFCEFWTIKSYTKIKNRFGNTNVYNFGLFGHFLKGVAFALAPTPLWVMAASATQSISFSFTIPGAVEYVSENIDRRYLATAQLVSMSLSMSLAQIIGNPIYGVLARDLGLRPMIFLTSFTALLGAVIFRVYNLRTAQKKKNVDKL